jgi:mono/diheme cytochrome c family protein
VKLTVPVPLKIAALAVATTGFYAFVGQLVPQKEVLPPKETVFKKGMTQAELVETGKEIMNGKGLCFTCHTLGKKEGPYRFPDMDGVGSRAATRRPGLTAQEYLAQSIYEPSAYIVPGFAPGMPVINKPPIGLTDQEIVAVIAYLESLGGKVTVSEDSKVWPLGADKGGKADAAAAGAAAPAKAGS